MQDADNHALRLIHSIIELVDDGYLEWDYKMNVKISKSYHSQFIRSFMKLVDNGYLTSDNKNNLVLTEKGKRCLEDANN